MILKYLKIKKYKCCKKNLVYLKVVKNMRGWQKNLDLMMIFSIFQTALLIKLKIKKKVRKRPKNRKKTKLRNNKYNKRHNIKNNLKFKDYKNRMKIQIKLKCK